MAPFGKENAFGIVDSGVSREIPARCRGREKEQSLPVSCHLARLTLFTRTKAPLFALAIPLFRSYLEQLDQFLDLPVFGGKVHVALGPEIWRLLVFLAL